MLSSSSREPANNRTSEKQTNNEGEADLGQFFIEKRGEPALPSVISAPHEIISSPSVAAVQREKEVDVIRLRINHYIRRGGRQCIKFTLDERSMGSRIVTNRLASDRNVLFIFLLFRPGW